MNKSLLIIFSLVGALALISCGKKGDGGSACPAGQMQITDQRMLQIYNQNYGHYGNQPYNQGYNQFGNNQFGYNQQGYNQYGYNQPGYNQHGYNQHGYNPGVACVDQYTYQQIQQQAYGYSNMHGNQPNLPQHPGHHQPGYGVPPGGNSPSALYCMYFPHDSFCTGRWY